MKKRHTSTLDPRERELGMASAITRRDFIGGTVIGAGSLLLDAASPLRAAPFPERIQYNVNFNGPPADGDYRFSNGNTWEVLSSAHRIRDGKLDAANLPAHETGEMFDLVIVGGGPAGLGGAYYFQKETGGRGACLILENHPIFGGEAKRNELYVDGERLIAPQGSNLMFTPTEPGDGRLYEELTDIGMPLDYEYASAVNTTSELSFDRTNYFFLWLAEMSKSVGFFNHNASGKNAVVRNPWAKNLDGTHFSHEERAALLRWKFDSFLPQDKEEAELDRWLDTMSVEQFLSEYHQLPPVVARYCDEVLGSAIGLGSSTCSAYIGKHLGLAGFIERGEGLTGPDGSVDQLRDAFNQQKVDCFPGGNAYVARYFVRHLVPGAFPRTGSPGEMIRSPLNFDALDQTGNPTRIRLRSTAVRVEHLRRCNGKGVKVTYERDGQLNSVRAKAVLMASGGWINRSIISDLPALHRGAFESFLHAPVLVANVALRNWRFLDRLGITACRWFNDSFGFSCNIRNPIQVDGYKPPLDPDRPIMLTFYAPIVYGGLSAKEQGVQGRWKVFGTSFREYERQIRGQMIAMFSAGGFDPDRDIAGIILNRWGHAYVVPKPGFFYDRGGTSTASNTIRDPFDRIAFAHSELRGLQNFRGAVYESKRAIRQLKEYF